MKKIGFITPIYLPANISGSNVVVKELAEKLAKEGNDVSVITTNALNTNYWYNPLKKKIKSSFEIINGVKIYRLKCNQLISISTYFLKKYFKKIITKKLLNKLDILSNGPYMKELTNLLRKQNFDIIHASPFPLFINKQVIESIKKIDKKPKLIVTPFFHTELEEYNNPLLKQLLDNSDLIHVVSNYEAEFINKKFGINKNKIVYVPLFIKKEELHNINELKQEINNFKKENKINSSDKLVLFAGNKGYFKGALTVLKAVHELNSKNSKYKLIAIGNSTKEWNKLKNTLKTNSLIDLDYAKSKYKESIFALSDVFCMVSKSDSFGLVYLEAWHKKKPVIACNIPAVKELISDTGLLVDFDNVTALKKALKKLLEDKNLMNKKGLLGYKRLNNYYFNNVWPKYNKIFK